MYQELSNYQSQLVEKTARLTQLLAPFNPPPIEVFSSPEQHYRMRAEFRVWHEQDELYHVMFDPQTKRPYRVDQFPIATQLINRMMSALIALLKENTILRHKLFQIDYLSTLSNQIIISLLYHKTLNNEWEIQAQQLKQRLQEQGFHLHIIGRAKKQKICLSQDYIDEQLTVTGNTYIYRQVENSFTQPNAHINIAMLQWAIDCTKESQTSDLLELYCGNGNFSIALAQNFRRVLATEIANPSVAAAQYNIQANQIDNLTIIRMSAEEFTQAIKQERQFNRLQGIDLSDYQCETVLVDPPRAGLDDDTLAMIQAYQRILYISCNPHTLCQNLTELTKTHRIVKAALFDQFPYTEHMETGVWLIKK